MKTIYSKIILIALSIFVTSCDDNETISNTNVSSVTTLYSPTDNSFFNLGAASSALFEWQAAKAEDNGVVLYDVVFDIESGDFSNPIYVTPSDGKGLQRTLNISFTDLNRIAEMAGIESKKTGKLKWTVLSSKGLDIQKSEVSGIFDVERPAGFPMPDELFISGSATEGGAEISTALPFKKVGATKYEIYTSLKSGDYHLITRKTDNALVYSINDSDLEENGSTTYTDAEKVYRIKIDFSDGSVIMSEVQKIDLWFPPKGELLYDFIYSGNGTWKASNVLIEFKQEGWGRDERYKFKFTIDGQDEWFGSANGDNQRPNDDTSESFWYMMPVSDDYWSNCFKFNGNVDNKNADIEVNFKASISNYTHKITAL
ncbi:hypothetical protein FF125_02940 [Aureibaculum algae]|uniref:SusE outer membrane protein domain-containing protein n=1 Tax=Aureibaculum algae TaxID=2584122 RepID=A0A5B7TLA2_9FLAO|nr:SusE domain-containing protein [Aureibaculum algae]QCX37439.1 hypothetical protein FF125_02940 [Aureibaculum algae]